MRNTVIDDNVMQAVAERYGTPCLCYEQDEIEYWESSLKNALPDTVHLIYSVKASSSPILLNHYIKNGMFFETASKGELVTLLSMKADPKKIWVSGQGKNSEYIRYAVDHGIRHFHLESERELTLLSMLLPKNEKCACCIRINPSSCANDTVLCTGGGPSAFGIDEEKLVQILLSPNGELVNGIFVYAGSQYFKADYIIQNTVNIFELAKKFYEILGRCVENIDFGGGFGVPENDDTEELDLRELQSGLKRVFAQYKEAAFLSQNTSFYFESGRYMAARTAYLITRIIDIKESQGQKFLITDGGINQLGVKQAEYRIYPPYIRHIGKALSGEKDTYTIVGNTCTSIDLTHPGVDLNTPQIGDLICIPDCGGYSLDFSPALFNGFYSAAQVLHCQNRIICFVGRGTETSPYGRVEYVPIGSGYEIQELMIKSCPKDSDEVQNIAVVANAIGLRHSPFVIFDMSGDGTDTVILLKILDAHYCIIPDAVFSDFKDIAMYTSAACYSMTEYEAYFRKHFNISYYVLITGTEYCENDVAITAIKLIHLGASGFIKVESELMDSMEQPYYSYYIHHILQMQHAFELLEDFISKQCFLEYIRTVVENDFWRLDVYPLLSKYWGYDKIITDPFYKHLHNERWLNIGACNGDTIYRFFRNGYSMEHIYAVDTDTNALARCKSNLLLLDDSNILDRISFHNLAFGCCKEETRLDDMFATTSLSLINMDIEGAEKNVLDSAKMVICRDRPVLAICIYHRPEDLTVLADTIHSICRDYHFYIRKYPNYPFHRYNSKEEVVLYAVPPERQIK